MDAGNFRRNPCSTQYLATYILGTIDALVYQEAVDGGAGGQKERAGDWMWCIGESRMYYRTMHST